MNREKSKIIEINSRRFRVDKFDAQTGSYIAYQLLTNFLPMLGSVGNGFNISLDMKPDELFKVLPKTLPMMEKEQFFKLQKDCLEVCFELTRIGDEDIPVKVILHDGRFGIADIENDAFTVMLLTVHALVFNVSGFFGVSGLKGLNLG